MIQFRELPAASQYYRAPALENCVGLIPNFLHEGDDRPAKEQIHERYAHGGGWFPIEGFTLEDDQLLYPGDDPLPPLAEARLRDERIIIYPYSVVAIIQPDGSFDVARLD